jgi:hypothetical protein
MNQRSSCSMRPAVDDHFSGRITPAAERALRDHLPTCPECRKYYHRHQVLTDLDPEGIGPQERLARGLGLDRKPGRRRLVWMTAPALVAAAAFALLVIRWPVAGPEESAVVSRGGKAESSPARLEIYQVQSGEPAVRVQNEIGARDELAFAYENRAGKKRLLVFGVDEGSNIYWYHPAWQDPAQNPVAVAIEGGEGIRELPEAIEHSIRGKWLRIYAVFTDDPIKAKSIEALIRTAGKPLEVLPLENVIQESILVKVRH